MSNLKSKTVTNGGKTNQSVGLDKFRDEWKEELNRNAGEPTAVAEQSVQVLDDKMPPHDECLLVSPPANESPYAFQYTDNLMKSWQDPSPSSFTLEKRNSEDENLSSDEPAKKQRRSMVDVFLADLNDIDEIPFFDVDLPREIAVNIFSHLDIIDLCACSQVSKAWQFLAEDCVLWENIFRKITAITQEKPICEGGTCKDKVKSLISKRRNLQMNWKEHKCETRHYSYARGGVLTSADYHNHILLSGYSSGKIKSWNILTGESHSYDRADEALIISDEDHIAVSHNTVTCVKASFLGIAAGYNHGDIQVWNHTAPDEMLLMKFPSNRIKDIDVQSSLLYTQLLSRQSYQSQIKILSADQSSLNVIDTITIREADQKYKLPKTIFCIIPSKVSDGSASIAYLLQDSLNTHSCSQDYNNSTKYNSVGCRVEEFVATSFSCLACTQNYIHLGMTSNLGLQAEYKMRCYDIQKYTHLYDLRGHTSHVTCVDNSFTTPNIISTGCHDRRVRLYDTRIPGYSPIHTLMGHHGTVECIQCDDNKIVSGDDEGYVCVWDQRTTSKLWESKNSHPVKMLKFTHEYLISANIPSNMPDFDEVDDDGIAHLRMRGRLQVSDFSTTQGSLNISIS